MSYQNSDCNIIIVGCNAIYSDEKETKFIDLTTAYKIISEKKLAKI